MNGRTEEQILAENEQLRGENLALKNENKILREKIDALVKKVFGSSSERLDSNQLSLFGLNQENVPGKSDASLVNKPEEAATQALFRPAKARPQGRPKGIPENLPIVEEIVEPEEVKQAPEKWRSLGDEVSDQLDYTPGRFFLRRLIRRKYVSAQDKDAGPIIAELPNKLLERGQIAPGLLAHVIVSKYCDHLPLYRQEQIYWQRHGVWLPRQRMAFWLGVVADWVQLIYAEIRRGVMEAGYVQLDETPVRYLVPGHGKTKKGYFWTACRPGGDVFFRWEVSRGAECLKNMIPVNFKGTVQSDGYAAYARLEDAGIQMAGCMAHARRNFFKAKDLAPQVATWVLIHMSNLYQIEEELRKNKASPKVRELIRGQRSAPIYRRLIAGLKKLQLLGQYLPRSGMAQAINYAVSFENELGVFLENGRIEIDNNQVENAIRPTAIGKKNWLFIGEAEAGERSAVLYTLIECCRRRGIDPEAYFKDILIRLPNMTNKQVTELTPENWAKARKIEPLQKAA